MATKHICDNPGCTEGDGGTVKEVTLDLTGLSSPFCPFDPPRDWSMLTKQGDGGLEVVLYCCMTCHEAGEGA